MTGILFRLLIFTFSLGFLTVFQTNEASAQVLEQTFSENLADFSISTPNAKWFLAPRSVAPGPVRATLRFQTPVDKFSPNATVRVTPLAQKDATAEKIVEQDLKSLPASIKILEKGPVEQEPLKGYQVKFIDEKAQIQFLQWIFIAKGKSFVITCAAKVSSAPRFEEDFKKILTSFKIR